MTDLQALTHALVLSVTAPDDARSKDALALALGFASRLTPEQVEMAKADAQGLLA
jgi:hypothetical protein